MVFSSISFIFFILPLFLILDGAAARWAGARWRNAVLLALSLLFYIWGESTNVLLLVGMGFLNYYGARRMIRCARPKLAAGILAAVNLGLLFVFKYLPWLVSLIDPRPEAALRLSLPLGISFFTFHAVSYVLDVYRRDIEPASSPLKFLTYFCMFPHLVAGPIVRYRQVAEDLHERRQESGLFAFGMYRFLLGFNKKMLVANIVAPMADAAFLAGVHNFGDAWLGAAAYTVQIYFDFSAYSDMAIGLAAMAGFRFEENFNRPYSALSIRDFWRRWHISLSSWLRDYLYIPLGGSRKGEGRTLLNLLTVFFLCGLWHGAEFTFIIWGLWHGLFLIIERLGLGRRLTALPAFCGRAYTLLVVMTGWVFFRAADLDEAWSYLTVMFNPAAGSGVSLTDFRLALAGLGAGIVISLWPDRRLPRPDSHNPGDFSAAAMIIQGLLFFPSLMVLVSGSRNPFIYFNF